MPHAELYSREQIVVFLPRAIQTALASYRMFSRKPISREPKEFKDHHNACKVAVEYIELLLKLAKWAELPDERLTDDQAQSTLKDLIEAAQGEIEIF